MRRYDHPEISDRYFFPMPSPPLGSDENGGALTLSLDDGTPIGAYWHRPLAGAPTLLYTHGNGECIADQIDHWPAWAARAGANIFFLDYPGYATSGGQPTISGCAEAGVAALDHLLAQPEEVVPAVIVVGRSVGSIFALHTAWQARSPRVLGLVLESGVADLKRRLELRIPYEALALDRAAIEAQLDADFDHERKVRELVVPLLVLHTRHDDLVPAWNAERLAAWAGERLHHLELFERGGHNDIQWINAEAYQRLLGEFVDHVFGG
jgi:pimeloyl-ACP methyl ester carboxylesterase